MKEFDTNAILLSYRKYLEGEKHVAQNTLVSYLRDLQQFDSWLLHHGREELSGITQSSIREYADFLELSGKSCASVTRCIAAIHGFCRWLYLSGQRSDDPSSSIRAKKGTRGTPSFLTSAEIERLINQPNSREDKGFRDRTMLLLLYSTGLRVSEMLALDVSDVNTTLGEIYCVSRKGNSEIRIHAETVRVLRDYLRRVRPCLAERGEQALFVNKNGRRMTRQGFWKLLKTYQVSAGIEKEITPHMLRHSCAAHLLEKGADAQLLHRVLGHADLSYTQVYIATLDRNLRESAEAIRATG